MACTVLWLLAFNGRAVAGGHFDIDDAGTLDPGQCQYETWYGRAGAEPANVFHVGPACRVGPVEVGLNLDRFRVAGEPHAVAVGPQLKWTWFGAAADASLSAAVSAGATWDRTHRGKPGRQLVFPVSWRPLDNLQVHANIGADWAPVSGTRTGRGGLATEWALHEQLSLLAERHRSFGAWTTRVGARVSVTPLASIDLSASRTGAAQTRGFYIGINHEFSRP